jgi:type I restriction enzyme S subunit
MNYEADVKNESSTSSLGGVARSAGVVDGQALSKPTRETSNDAQLPAGWATASLGAITLPRETANPKTLGETLFQHVDIDALNNRSNKITSPKQIKGSDAPSRARMAIRKGDVLFSLVRPYLKNIAVVPEELDKQIASTAYCILRPAAGMESGFLFYQLLQDSFIHAVPTYGNSPPSARDDEFLELHVQVAPTSEQKRIVEKIEELLSDLDAGVAALERARANLKRYRAAVLKAAVEGKLTEQWRKEHPDVEPASKLLDRILAERRKKWEEVQLAKYAAAGKTPPNGWKDKYPEPARPDTPAMPDLPHGWCWVTVEQCASFEPNAITDGPFGSNLKTAHYTDSGPRVIRLQNIGDGDFVDEQAHISQTHFLSLQKHAVNAGDLVIALLGEELPRACIVPAWVPPAIVKADCVRVKPNNELAQTEYLNAALNSQPTRELATLRVKGVGRPRLNLSSIREIALPLPPIEEQREIAALVAERISTQEQTEREISKAVRRASNLRQAILKRAFEGKLVPQDSTDEPASILLERIRAARAASAPPARKGRGKRIRAA